MEGKKGIITINTFKIMVDYDIPLEQMIKTGRFNDVHCNITEEDVLINKRAKGEIELHLVILDRYMCTKQILAEFDKQGLRPAELLELLALNAAYPDLHKEYPLIALGSKLTAGCSPVGGTLVPLLYRNDGGRELILYLDSPYNGWDGSCGFVAVRKKEAE